MVSSWNSEDEYKMQTYTKQGVKFTVRMPDSLQDQDNQVEKYKAPKFKDPTAV